MVQVGIAVAGLVVLAVGGDLLVRGASRIALAARMSPLLVGLTVVALGTSAPELASSTVAAVRGKADIALGNVIGSNIANVLLVLGAAALAAPLTIKRALLRFDVPIMAAAALAVPIVGWDGIISRAEGAVLVLSAVAYMLYSILSARGARTEAPEWAASPMSQRLGIGRALVETAIGLALLVLGARWLVDGAVGLARALGLSEIVIGLTVVAVGTSLPEIAASIIAASKGQRDIAVGNVVGSNTLNVCTVLGVSSVVAPAGIPVHPAALYFDVPVMVATSLACLPVFFTGARICRTEGLFMVGYYAAYVLYLVLNATGHDQLPVFNWTMGAFVIPITLALLGSAVYRQMRDGRRSRTE